MRTVIHTTAANFVPANGQGCVVTVKADALRAYHRLQLRLDERHPLRAIASRKAEKRCLWTAPAGTIRPLWHDASMRMAGSSCLRPTRPCRPLRFGNLG